MGGRSVWTLTSTGKVHRRTYAKELHKRFYGDMPEDVEVSKRKRKSGTYWMSQVAMVLHLFSDGAVDQVVKKKNANVHLRGHRVWYTVMVFINYDNDTYGDVMMQGCIVMTSTDDLPRNTSMEYAYGENTIQLFGTTRSDDEVYESSSR